MEKRTLEPILASCSLFKGLPKSTMELLVGCASNARFRPGQFIMHEGESANTFYLLREGHVAVELSAAGRPKIAIQTLEAGDILGWSWLFPPYRWHFDARAIEPVHAIALDGKCLRGKCEKDLALGYEMMKRFARVIMQRLRASQLQLIDVYGTHV